MVSPGCNAQARRRHPADKEGWTRRRRAEEL